MNLLKEIPLPTLPTAYTRASEIAFVGGGCFKAMKAIPIVNSDKVVLVDDEDYDFLMQYRWYYTSPNKVKEYVNTYIGGKGVFMHRMLTNAGEESLVDHRDGNGLNNQRYNLRECTYAQNRANSLPNKTNKTSAYKGVHLGAQGWQASIKFQQRTYGLGWFDCEHEAALAYNLKAEEVFGEFALLNKIPEGTRLSKVGKHIAHLVTPDIIKPDAKIFTYYKNADKNVAKKQEE